MATNMNRKDFGFVTAVFFILLTVTGCERRELYVYGEEFHSVTLDVDWRNYSSTDPDGMTVWFYPLDNPAHGPYRTTTASVRHQDIYLPGGRYQGVVVDYSPEEYSRQEFLGLDTVETARVEAVPAAYQPDSLTVAGEGVAPDHSEAVNLELYGEPAWTDMQTRRPPLNERTGLYTVDEQPEEMALDTLDSKTVAKSAYGDYIPWKERDTYQSSIIVQQLYSQPETIVWKLRIRIWIRSGFNYLWQSPSSITGLANGHFLGLDKNTDVSSLLNIGEWELQRTGDNSGYIGATLSTFGLRPESILDSRQLHVGTRAPGDTEPDYGDEDWWSYYTGLCLPEQLRLNLSFTLRDHATVCNYHFNVGHCVVSFDEQLVLRIDLGEDFFYPGDPGGPQPIDLPYVEAYNGTGFDAKVTPWQDEPPVDVTM